MSDAIPALDSYRDEASKHFTPPPVERTIAAGRRRVRRRRQAALAATVVAAAVGVATLFLPRGAGRPAADSLEDVDWTRASITLPASPDQACPAGRQKLEPGDGADLPRIGKIAGRDGGKSLAILPGPRSYGDLTGDGSPEVVLPVWCGDDIEPPFGERGAQLLVVARAGDGSLTGLGYVGPVGAHYQSFRVTGGKLVVQVEYQTLNERNTVYSVYAPAHARTYSWDGSRFIQTAGRTSPLTLSPDKEPIGSPVRLAAILGAEGATVCPSADLRFAPSTASAAGATYLVTDNVAQTDLDADGNEELLVQITCRAAAYAADSLYLLGQGTDGFVTLDVPFANDGRHTLKDWKVTGKKLTITFAAAGGHTETRVMSWTGSRFSPAVGSFRPIR